MKQYRLNGMLSTLLAGGLLVCGLTAGQAEILPEITLPSQDITISGTVTVPSCTVRLENETLNFARDESTAAVMQAQTLKLNIGQCDVDSVGVMFKAEHWPDFPFRGALSHKKNRKFTGEWYYTIGPAEHMDVAWPLKLTADSPVPERDKLQGGNVDDLYFSLSGINYWYDLKVPLKENDVVVIPFSVRVHHAMTHNNDHMQDELISHFTLQVTWK